MPEVIPLRPIPLWAEEWNAERLRARAAESPRAFERGFRMRAHSDAESTFPSFQKCERPGLVLGDLIRNSWPAFVGVDLAGRKRPGNAIVTVKVDPVSRRRYPVDVRYGAWRSSETARQIEDVNRQFRPIVIMVENNGYQQALIDWVADQKSQFSYWSKVEATTTTDGKKGDAYLGLPGLEVEFHNESWCFPLSEYEGATGDDADARRAAWARLAYEIKYHPIASTSDGLMALWMARQGIESFSGLALSSQSGDFSDFNAR